MQQEENNNLKMQNEDLATKLRRSEVILSRVKEELARHRALFGKNQYLHFAEDQQLRNELKVGLTTMHMWECGSESVFDIWLRAMLLQETEEQRVELAQKLLSLCTKILKVSRGHIPNGPLQMNCQVSTITA